MKPIETSIVAKMQAAEDKFKLNADDVIKDTEDLLCHWKAEKEELLKRFNLKVNELKILTTLTEQAKSSAEAKL